MANIPFMHPMMLQSTQLPVPDRNNTPEALPIFDLEKMPVVNSAVEGYRRLYGLDHLSGTHWQGYLNITKFKIHVQVFQPDVEKIKGTVWLIHGYLEHSGIYQPIIKELLEQDFSVITYDLPGHGLSDGTVAGIANFDDYQDVLLGIRQVVEPVRQLPKPWLGIGQSTGGAILMHHILDYAEQRRDPMVDRVLLLSPLVRPAKSAWWHNSIGLGIVSRIKRQVPRHFRRNNHNPEFLRFVRLQDPLQPRTMSMDWILAMAKWMVQMEQRPACRIPVWLAQGALDQTVDWQYNIEYIRKKFRLQTSLILEEGSHQLINERADIRAALTGLIPAFLHAQYKRQYYQ
ncbi:alpha/beta hydrolase [Acinetobacter qingfengensis]|uniref:Lysophospholipase n=1 Tax=Acinetobacter qingfengensis TaxID=1262585 RepID=A0A1E7RDM7_9GAMM|nr:alpha/beta hydrolase [Acinetobacter qingfengensis]KAA8735330.1 alpha/beta hydrolase [Acinetobacter qingfengensis]OEY97448.1 lysophospholipase [Acinetobacter qingfengensis]